MPGLTPGCGGVHGEEGLLDEMEAAAGSILGNRPGLGLAIEGGGAVGDSL